MFNPFEIFGWEFKKRKEDEEIKAPYVQPYNDDAAFTVGTNGYSHNSYHLSLDQTFVNENELIKKYREMSLHPEVDAAVTDIVNESIDGTNESSPVEIVLDDLEQPDKIKKIITEEFKTILKLLNFNNESYDIFRKWYVDGRLFYHIIIDKNKTSDGIQELRYMSPLFVKKVREEEKDTGPGGFEIIKRVNEYFVYAPYVNKSKSIGIKLSKDSTCYITSGLHDEESSMVYSYLHKAIKPTNQLRMIEDAIIIYRLSRAPERRVFYVDVGNLPTKKSEEYLRNIMRQYKNKMVYDAVTGEVKDSKHTVSMMEDFWMPRREGGRGTEISTLPGGQNLGDIEDIDYFKRKLYQALNVPLSRITAEQAGGFNIGRASEITRDEVKFSKYVSRLRKKFSALFYQLLRTQLLLKKVITEDEWKTIAEQITFDFISDVYFAELKEAEILRERVATVSELSDLIGVYYSKEWVRKNVLQMSDEEIKEMDKQIEEENAQESDDEFDNQEMNADDLSNPNDFQ